LLITTISSFTSAELNLELPDLNLPDLGGQAGITVGSRSERETGLKILRELRSSGDIIEDPELSTWIRSVGNRITSNAPQSPTPFYFVISRDQSVNAFATLGGVIVVNAGLILRTESESELAAVMAHETAHVTQRHIPRMIKKAEGNKFASGAAILAGILASTKDPQAGQAIINISLATMAHKQLSFGREAESEADRVGLRILARSGFDPKAMPSFLEKLEQFSDDQDADVREFLQSHPLTLKRVSDTQERAKKFAAYKGKKDLYYSYMKEKVRILSKSNSRASDKSNVKRKVYSAALKLAQQNKNQRALQTLGANKSNVIPEAILISKLLNKQRRYKEALSILVPLLEIYLGNEALSVLAAQAYLSDGQHDKAWATLNEISVSEQTSLEFFEAKQGVARLTGHRSEAYKSAAEKNIRMGNYKSAISLLRQAIKLPGTDASELLQMQRLLEQIKSLK
ncbi:MAG: M48 family metallopeptidase, partial [Thiotrichaceae bacterium]|nr:M48 family metallopeptidase [Thiotrichaceae bacterium]